MPSSIRSKTGADISDLPCDSRDSNLILIVAGEASGDLHGAGLVKAIRKRSPRAEFLGIGGEKMQEAGVRILFPSADMAVVGLTEVFSRLRIIARAYFRLKSILKSRSPCLVILVDYPEFNLLLARAAKRFHVPILYYISPQVWAWRSGRVKKLARRVDRMAVILPFERQFYQERGMDVEYVGHPLLDVIPEHLRREEIVGALGMEERCPIIGILPGSRKEEVTRLLPVMVKAAENLYARYPRLACLLPQAPTIPSEMLETLTRGSKVEIKIQHDMYRVLAACDIVLVASGTATLEAAIMQVPMVVVYKVSPITNRLGRMVVKVPYISLVNLIAGERIVPELIQDEVTPERLAHEAESILESSRTREIVLNRLASFRQALGEGSASEKTAGIALEMIRNAGSSHRAHRGSGQKV